MLDFDFGFGQFGQPTPPPLPLPPTPAPTPSEAQQLLWDYERYWYFFVPATLAVTATVGGGVWWATSGRPAARNVFIAGLVADVVLGGIFLWVITHMGFAG